MLTFIGLLTPAILLFSGVACSTLNASGCIGPVTVASNCNFYDSKLSECNSFTGSQAASCYCPQTVLDAIAGCESEYRLCAEGYEFDSNFTGTTGLYALWHSACDDVITYSPTTPVLTSLSLTFDPLNCISAQSYCQNFGVLTDACSATITESSGLRSCMCQASVLDLASRCYIDGSVSCLFKTPTLTNRVQFKSHCHFSHVNCRAISFTKLNGLELQSIGHKSVEWRGLPCTESKPFKTGRVLGSCCRLHCAGGQDIHFDNPGMVD